MYTFFQQTRYFRKVSPLKPWIGCRCRDVHTGELQGWPLWGWTRNCPMLDTAATIPPQDTAEHISHCQMWENIFKKGQKMSERKADRDRAERGGNKGEITARTWRLEDKEEKKEVLHSGADIPKGLQSVESKKGGATERNFCVLTATSPWAAIASLCNLCWWQAGRRGVWSGVKPGEGGGVCSL